MIDDRTLQLQLAHTLRETHFDIGTRYQGKVRDTYAHRNELLMITTDRISAFDRVLGTIPFKGQVLSQITAFWFEAMREVAPSHMLAIPDPNVLVTRRCNAIPVEVVMRGYLTGSLWREYSSGAPDVYEISLPKGMAQNQAFEHPLLTPAKKMPVGEHDEPISSRQVVAQGIVDAATWAKISAYAMALFTTGSALALQRGLILVDTKYEFGVADGELLVIDEIHTPDSSRFWLLEGHEERMKRGDPPRMLDKENVRQWLLDRGFSGEGAPPALPDELRIGIARIYVDLYERMTGKLFVPATGEPIERVEAALRLGGWL